MEEEIKNATAAKLKGFIIMKTKSITNSMSKWDKQATCRVKSIIDWIKIGGNNNREAIKRVEKRNRDHFRHKAHKKPRKKGRDSTVHSTLRQTFLSGFVSLNKDLY